MKLFSLTLLTTLILITSLISCKKKKEDEPVPVPVNYRIKTITYDNNNFKATGSFTYNAKNQLIKIATKDNASSEIIRLETYQYNTSGFKTQYTNAFGTDVSTYNYEYSGNNLLTTKLEYSGTDINTPIKTTTYYYDQNNNMVMKICKTPATSGYKDSIIFSGFINGTPTLQTTYIGSETYNPGIYIMAINERYTYDERMNLVLREQSKNNDLNTYYNSAEYTYTPYTNEMNKMYNVLKATYDETEYGLKTGTDFMTSHKVYGEQNCNSEYEPKIRSNELVTATLNSNNLISQVISTSDSYDGCGNVTSNFNNTSNYVYEQY